MGKIPELNDAGAVEGMAGECVRAKLREGAKAAGQMSGIANPMELQLLTSGAVLMHSVQCFGKIHAPESS